jgi:hypothetical protein
MSKENKDFADSIGAEYVGDDNLFYKLICSKWVYFSIEDYAWVPSIADDDFHLTLEAI